MGDEGWADNDNAAEHHGARCNRHQKCWSNQWFERSEQPDGDQHQLAAQLARSGAAVTPSVI